MEKTVIFAHREDIPVLQEEPPAVHVLLDIPVMAVEPLVLKIAVAMGNISQEALVRFVKKVITVQMGKPATLVQRGNIPVQ